MGVIVQRLYMCTFACVIYPKADHEKPDNERAKQISMTDMVVEGDTQEALQKAMGNVVSSMIERGYILDPNLTPTFTRRRKKDMLTFFDKGKKSITQQNKRNQEIKNEERKKLKKIDQKQN